MYQFHISYLPYFHDSNSALFCRVRLYCINPNLTLPVETIVVSCGFWSCWEIIWVGWEEEPLYENLCCSSCMWMIYPIPAVHSDSSCTQTILLYLAPSNTLYLSIAQMSITCWIVNWHSFTNGYSWTNCLWIKKCTNLWYFIHIKGADPVWFLFSK